MQRIFTKRNLLTIYLSILTRLSSVTNQKAHTHVTSALVSLLWWGVSEITCIKTVAILRKLIN